MIKYCARLIVLAVAAAGLGGCASRGDTVTVRVLSNLGRPLEGATVHYTSEPDVLIVVDRKAGGERDAYCIDRNTQYPALLTATTDASGRASLRWAGRPIFAFVEHEQGYAVADNVSREDVTPIRLQPWSTIRADLSSRVPKGDDSLVVRFTVYLPSAVGGHCVALDDVAPVDAAGRASSARLAAGRVRLSLHTSRPQLPQKALERWGQVSLWTDVVTVTPGGHAQIDATPRGCAVRGTVAGAEEGDVIAQLKPDTSLRPWADSHRPDVKQDLARGVTSHAARLASEELYEYQVKVGQGGAFEFPDVAPGEYLLTIVNGGNGGSFHVASFEVRVRSNDTHLELGALNAKP